MRKRQKKNTLAGVFIEITSLILTFNMDLFKNTLQVDNRSTSDLIKGCIVFSLVIISVCALLHITFSAFVDLFGSLQGKELAHVIIAIAICTSLLKITEIINDK